ncbi:MAG: hypothetical protein ACRDRA_15065, partial [Pseudonocardiaceae bacterium]
LTDRTDAPLLADTEQGGRSPANETGQGAMTDAPDYRCPSCNTESQLIMGPEQAFCTNEHGCRVFSFNPSLADGGLSQAKVIDLG